MRIAAIVVTYNRLDDLKNCVQSLRHQTYRDFDIVVVNNGSTDGTRAYLDCLSDIVVIHQSNLGGAGGFYAGQKYAYENGYDWVWMMDDDGIADERELEELVKNVALGHYLNALVVNRETKDKLSFYGPHGERPDELSLDYLRKEPYWKSYSCPFNGTFFSRKLMETIGFVKKEMFIWGDEVEYTLRAYNSDFPPITVTSAIHYHPSEKGKTLHVFGNYNILFKPKHLSKYYYRNCGYLARINGKGKPLKIKLYVPILYSIYYLKHFNLVELLKVNWYFACGWFNYFK